MAFVLLLSLMMMVTEMIVTVKVQESSSKHFRDGHTS
jgi:hypothetical protein